MAASKSGNVNAAIVYDLFRNHLIPWMRKLGVTVDNYVAVNWDRQSSHEGLELFDLLSPENMHPFFFPPENTIYFNGRILAMDHFRYSKTRLERMSTRGPYTSTNKISNFGA